MAAATSLDARRLAMLSLGVFVLIAPLFWIGWNLAALGETAGTIRTRTETLESLRARLSDFLADPESGGGLDALSVYLPGETGPIAGAVLQRIVTDTVQEAGGRLTESEIVRSDAGDADPGRVDLRASFDADIVALQRILFRLETGLPILMVQALSAQSGETFGTLDNEQPVLRVVMQVEGHWAAGP
jgi:hypothetical protein